MSKVIFTRTHWSKYLFPELPSSSGSRTQYQRRTNTVNQHSAATANVSRTYLYPYLRNVRSRSALTSPLTFLLYFIIFSTEFTYSLTIVSRVLLLAGLYSSTRLGILLPTVRSMWDFQSCLCSFTITTTYCNLKSFHISSFLRWSPKAHSFNALKNFISETHIF